MSNSTELSTYSFTSSDIDLITFALRRLSESTGIGNLAAEAKELLEYVEKEKEDKQR
jgi:hypothetical protein